VPEEAIIAEADDTFVYLASEQKAVRRSVKLGQRQPGVVEITKGLAAGEKIVVRGSQRLRDGVPIRVVGAEGKTDAPKGKKGASGKGNGT
jgi:membrane fusion protein (multidrug efflux system)